MAWILLFAGTAGMLLAGAILGAAVAAASPSYSDYRD